MHNKVLNVQLVCQFQNAKFNLNLTFKGPKEQQTLFSHPARMKVSKLYYLVNVSIGHVWASAASRASYREQHPLVAKSQTSNILYYT